MPSGVATNEVCCIHWAKGAFSLRVLPRVNARSENATINIQRI